MKKFTAEELREFNGRDGTPSYIAFEGKVYDVSKSWHWKRGNHWYYHRAGRDLTDEFDEAPHGEEMLEKFPVVGELIE
jgi:predicted heme/steroid binding protein